MSENLAASVRHRLLNLSRARQEDFNLLLTHYAIERLLYRLSQSPVSERFLLKGAMLFSLWTGQQHRPTRDLDLAGRGDSSAAELLALFQSLCIQPVLPDGLTFDVDSVNVVEIREGQEYPGQRVQMVAYLGTARVHLQIDIGFGDAVTPGPVDAQYPTLLDFPAPQLRVYPRETVIAEKLQAMISLGIANSRMKDFYDIWFMARTFHFEGQLLVDAIRATFERRRTDIPTEPPLALTEVFTSHPQKVRQWQAFLSRNEVDLRGMAFEEIIDNLRSFLLPPLIAASTNTSYSATWSIVDGWREQ